MYIYSTSDQRLIEHRVDQFRHQTRRFLAGDLDEDTYRQLRLRNGLYVERHAPMLRVALPYGVLDSPQLRCLADIADHYDRGYVHVTTRQNVQLNWPRLDEAPEILAQLARVQMHAIQTSGNCIRNITTDPLAGVAVDEIDDPRPWCELIRQWALLHPEFSFLPRKFKIAVTGSRIDRVAAQVHDLAVCMVKSDNGSPRFRIIVGGGLGRTPVIGQTLTDDLSADDLLVYLEAVMRVYNLHGRRDNIYKARIKILVRALGIDEFRRQVEREGQEIRRLNPPVREHPVEAIRSRFRRYEYRDLADRIGHGPLDAANPDYQAWYRRNTRQHRMPGYRIVLVSLKHHGRAPGDLDSESMRWIAHLADRYSQGEIRTTRTQNLVFAHVEQRRLPALWRALGRYRLARPNIDTIQDIVCCPGFDYCSLANATSIDVAADLLARFDDPRVVEAIGRLRINISGCVNACGHHHIGHIGLLGVDKQGEDYYQMTLGGRDGGDTRLGKVLGPALPKTAIGPAIESLVATYLELRRDDESFLDTLDRLGSGLFKERVYENFD